MKTENRIAEVGTAAWIVFLLLVLFFGGYSESLFGYNLTSLVFCGGSLVAFIYIPVGIYKYCRGGK